MRARQEKKVLTDHPKFQDWRRTNDAVMVPDPGFVKQLRILDPKAFVQWDWGSQRWEIWRKPQGKDPVMLMRVETKDKSYRELGADILLKLQAGDPRKYTLKQLVAYMDAIDDRVREQKERELRAKLDSLRIETQWYLKGYRAQVPRKWLADAIPIEGPKDGGVHLIKKRPTRTIAEVVRNA